MSTLSHKHIILGITGGIAAYKSADLTRRLIEAGAEVFRLCLAIQCLLTAVMKPAHQA